MSEDEQKNDGAVLLHGIGVSPGVVIGPAFLMLDTESHVVEHRIAKDQVDGEIRRFEEALIETRRQIREIQRNLEARSLGADASILDAHLMVLDDRPFIEEVVDEVRENLRNVEAVVRAAADRYASVLASVDDDYLRERVADVKDVARRIIRNLGGDTDSMLDAITKKHIVVACDLAPSDTASLRKEMVVGFATDMGSPTSHTAVMARALEIPAVVALHEVTKHAGPGDEVLIDGNKGVLIVRPTPEQLEEYGKVAEARKTIERELSTLRHEPAETLDGRCVTLSANVEEPAEIDAVLEYGAEGIGLFRSEYLFLARDRIVTEEEQALAYEETASRLTPSPVIIRTLDMGGDKFMPSLHIGHEANPFLGCRSIRLSLRETAAFRSQLRAILRASRYGNVKIMYPMISSVGEVLRANEILEEAKAELREAGTPFDEHIEAGAMIEIPSAALTAGVIAKHVQFFSIGTNDLIQYTIAVDRVNENVAYLYEPTHPAVLRLIRDTVDAGHENGIWVGLCGEMAADPLMTPLLLGLGLDEFSVAPSAVPLVKDAVRSVEYTRAKKLAETALSCETAVEVLGHCRELTRQVAPEILELV